VTVRVRFSPAPTGYLHVGGARSALFNWLYARKTGGRFILRIEDTDADRSRPELVDAIVESLAWLGLDWDEVNHQSARFEDYRSLAADLVARGLAYRCDCTQDEVKARAEARGGTPGYDGHCRDRDVAPGEGVVIRFRTPDHGVTGWDDVIRGRVEFDNAVLEDFVIVRSTGVPMFHLANAYDDHQMGITHVIRGEDLVNTTPRVLLLRQALGATDQPTYAHLPLIVNEKRQKLSKRRDDVSVGVYRERGYLPEALRNYLATLGWGPKDGIEIRPMEEIIEQFELSDINASPAFFDVKKLDHFNGEYVRMLSPADFVERSRPFAGDIDDERYRRLAPEIQTRIKRLDEIPEQLAWVTGPAPEPEPKDWAKVMTKDPVVGDVLDRVIDRLDTVDWTPEALEAAVLGVGDELGGVKTQVPVRMAVTGRRVGLPLFGPMAELDRGEVLARLRAARARL
jgi:glutamyl-tRNA synthetase